MSLTDRDFDAILAGYQELRRAHRVAAEERNERIYADHPELLANRNALTENAVQRAKAGVLHREDELAALEDERALLEEQREALLAEAGLKEEDLLPKVTCRYCGDTGFVNGEKCRCFLRKQREILYRNSRLDRILEEENFDTLRMDYYDRTSEDGEPSQYEQMLDVVEACRSFAENFDRDGGNILFYGQTGVGKTFLTNCIAKALLDSGHSVLYYSAISLFRLFSDQLSKEPDETAENALLDLYEVDLVIIDDLGTELRNSYTAGQFFHLINERLLSEKSTLISTNLLPDALAELYTERTASRILSRYAAIPLGGEDLRIRKKIDD